MKWLIPVVLWICIFSPIESNAQNTDIRRGMDAFQNRDFDQAISIFSRITEQNKSTPEPFIFLAASYLEQNLPVLAEFTADEGLDLFSNESAFRWLKAEALLKQQLPEQAREIYQYLYRYFETLRFSPVVSVSESRIRQRWVDTELVLSAIAYQSGNYDDALSALDTVIRLQPDHYDAQKNKIYIYHQMERWEDVIESSEIYLNKLPNDLDVVRMKASAHFSLDDLESLLVEYAKVYEDNPHDIDSAIIYAQILFANQRGGDAEQVYLELLQQYPDEIRVYQEFAKLHGQRMYLAAKANVLELMLEKFPDYREGYLDLAGTYELNKDWDKAREVYARLAELDGESDQLFIPIADTYISENNLIAAEQVLYEGLNLLPDDTQLILNLGSVLQLQQKWDESLNILNRLPDHQKKAKPGVQIARAYYYLGDYGNSEDILRNLNREGLSDPKAYLLLAKIEHKTDQIQAFETIKTAVEMGFDQIARMQKSIAGDFRTGSVNMSMAGDNEYLEYISNTSEQALKYLIESFDAGLVRDYVEEISSQFRNSPLLLYHVASFYSVNKEFDQALPLLNRALRVNSSFYEAHVAMGNIYSEMKDFSGAALSYERALSINPESDEIYRLIIRTHQMNGTLDNLADKWLRQIRIQRENEKLREHLIEVLHRTNRFDEAANIISS